METSKPTDSKEVSLRSPGEPEQTALEEQRAGIVSELTAVSVAVAAAASTKSTTDRNSFAGNLESTVKEKNIAVQKKLSQEEQADEEQEEEEEEEGEEEEEVEEEVEEEEIEEEQSVEEEPVEAKRKGVDEPDSSKPVETSKQLSVVSEGKQETPNATVQVEKEVQKDSEDVPLAHPAVVSKEPEEVEENLPIEETESPKESTVSGKEPEEDRPNSPSDHGDKPLVPPQTYLWEEVKKSKEQGGYPWTHLYKGEPEEGAAGGQPDRTDSPSSNRRRKVEDQTVEDESQETKKVKVQNGDHRGEDAQPSATNGHCAEPGTSAQPEAAGSSEPKEESPRRSRKRAASHEPETGGRHSMKEEIKHFFDEHPKIRSFSNSLTRQGKKTRTFVSRSLERAKSMADRQIDRARVQMNTLRRKKAASEPRSLPDQKILILRESPRLNNREIPAYVVRQPSDEVIDAVEEEKISKVTVETEASKTTVVVPDEIIELPKTADEEAQQQEQPESVDEPMMVVEVVAQTKATPPEEQDDRYEIIEPPKEVEPTPPVEEPPIVPVKAKPPQKAPRKKKEHHYEDIEDFLPQETAATVEETSPGTPDPSGDGKLKRQDHIREGIDPILGEMLGNDKIKISLQLQDEKFVDDMFGRRRKHLDEILQQSSEDEREKEVGQPVGTAVASKGLLAPLSSIDSTSSDEEARRTHLTPLAEESDTGSIDGSLSPPPRKQDSLKETPELPPVAECSKELELTPAEEHLLAEQETPEKPQAEVTTEDGGAATAQEAIPVVTTEQPKVDTRWSKMSDHEYEPIGEPPTVTPAKDGLLGASSTTDAQERKLSSASFLRVPGDEGDTISMEELQKSIEDRYFNLPTDAEVQPPGETAAASTTASEPGQSEKTNKVKAAMAKAQTSGKQAMAKAQESGKQAMAKAQESGKTLQKKLMVQTDRLKTKMSNIKLKKDKDQPAPLASPEVVTTPELEKLDFTLAVPKDEEGPQQEQETAGATVEEQETAAQESVDEPTKGGRKLGDKLKNIHMPKIQKPDFKRPEFTKISKPKMPKLKAPDMPKFLTEKPDFSKMKPDFAKMKLTRSKSMKEASPSAATSAASPSDVSVVGDAPLSAPAGKVNYTDFSTYPRLFDKFKRPKATPSGQASVRAGTPPPLEFTKTTKTTRTKGPSFISRWASDKSDDTESNRFLQYTGSELDERETSVERRMRQELERAEFEGPELALTEEQKQLEEYDKENREIHLASAARHEEFLKRKPPMERQESDLASEEEKQFWASSLGQKIRQNIDMNSNDLDFLDEEERLLVAKENATIDEEAHAQARMLLQLSKERSEKEFERRSSTPYTDKECQSSGSSSARRRKGVLEEIDDDEFFLRQKGISKDDIQMGEYISSAIKEGLSHPKNALADMGRYDYYDEDHDQDRDRDGLRRYYQPSFESDDVSNRQVDSTDFYRTFPPDRPSRKGKKSTRADDDDRAAPDDQDYEPEDDEDDLAFYDRQRTKYGSEQPQLLQSAAARYMDDDDLEDEASSLRREAMLAGSVVPPTPPTRRRKKRFRDVTPSDVNGAVAFTTGGKSISNTFIAEPLVTSTAVNRVEVPLAKEESFGTLPAPTPRRSRSRSQISKALNGDFEDDRVSRGAESLIVGIIDAPVQRESSYPYEVSESTGYATVRKEAPPRPPAPTIRRRKSTRSLDAQPQSTRAFNTLPNYHHSVSPVRPQRNYSTINPNRPPRRKSVISLNGEQQQQQQLKPSSSVSRDDVRGRHYEDVAPPIGPKPSGPIHSGDVANKMKDRPLPPPPRPTRKPRRPDGSDHHDLDGGAERLMAMDVEEVETATQTDEFGLDAEIAAVTERADRAQDGDLLEGALSRFREGNAKALSDRPKSSRSGSRPETPASILIERKVSTPSLAHESVVEASLTVQPLEEFDDDQYIAELVKKYVSDERKPEPSRKADTFERRFRKSTNSLTREDEIRPQEVGTSLRTPTFRSSRSSVDGRLSATTPEPLRNVEIAPNVIEEIVERLRTTEQHHIDELQKLHQEQLEGLRRQHDEQKRLQEQKLEEQQRQLLEQQNQQLLETQQLKEQILQQQEHQKMLLAQQQNQQQQLLVAQQQQQLLMEQQEKERELQREKERELLKEREQELERARERERELHLSRELELQRAREVEQQRARDLEQQRIREMELQRAREMEHQRLRELEIQRAIEAEQARQREMELHQKAAAAAATAAATAAVVSAATTPNVNVGAAPAPPVVVTNDTTVAMGDEYAATQEEKPSEGATEGASLDVVDGSVIAPPVLTAVQSEQPPMRPPPPSMATPFVYHPDYLSYAMPTTSSAAAAAYLTRPTPSDDDPSLTPLAPQRRRRHHRSKRESTSEEDFQRVERRHRHGTRSPEPPSIPSLGGQLVRACGSSLAQTGEDLMSMLRASSKDENKRDLHIAILILIVIVAGLMALGMSGEKAVHHHHWDYFSPPGHGSSA